MAWVFTWPSKIDRSSRRTSDDATWSACIIEDPGVVIRGRNGAKKVFKNGRSEKLSSHHFARPRMTTSGSPRMGRLVAK